MKKLFKRLLIVSIIGASVITYNHAAYATSEMMATDHTQVLNTSTKHLTWYFDSNINCWKIRDDQKVLNDCWIYDNGKWYFISEAGVMTHNTVVYYKDDSYYMQDDGSMLTNGNCTIITGSSACKMNAYADASGKLTILD